jgi:hypothetical protein
MPFKRSETREFIAAQAAELAKLAVAAKMTDLAYLLEIACIEANNTINTNARPKLKKVA